MVPNNGTSDKSTLIIKENRLPDVYFATLPNGIRHVHVQVPQTATTSIRVGLPAGHVVGSPDQKGVAHFLEHLVFAGTKKYPNRDDLYDLIDFVGGSHNAATGWHNVEFYTSVLAKDLDKGLDFLSEILINPLLREVDFDREKRIITDEAKGRLSSISYLSWQQLNKLYFNDPRWHTSAVASPDDVATITLESVKDFYKTFYRPDNAVIATAGPQNQSDMVQKIGEYFLAWELSTDVVETHEPLPKFNDSGTDFFNFITPLSEQVAVGLIKPGPDESMVPDYSQRIANSIFGGEIFSRLFKSIREDHGLSYGLGTDFTRNTAYGYWQFGAGLDHGNVSQFSNVYRQTLNDFQDNPISSHELQRAKNDLLASILFDSEKTSALTDIWLSEVMDGLKFKDFSSLIDSINSVTVDSATRWVNDFIQAPTKIVVTSKDPISRDQVIELF